MCSIQEHMGSAPQGSVLSMGRVFSMDEFFSTEGTVSSIEHALAQRAHNSVEARNRPWLKACSSCSPSDSKQAGQGPRSPWEPWHSRVPQD